MKDFYDFLNSGISDELLAAYIDGNTTETENQLIENSLNGDSILSEAYEIAHDGVSFESNFDWDLHKGDFGFWELGLPPAFSESDLITPDFTDDELFNFPESNIEENLSPMHDSFLDTFDSIDSNGLDVDDDMIEGYEMLDF